MPRNVRNFFISLSVDGRKERIETGPRSKDGGFELTVFIRDKGSVERALEIRGNSNGEVNSLFLDGSALPEGTDTISYQVER